MTRVRGSVVALTFNPNNGVVFAIEEDGTFWRYADDGWYELPRLPLKAYPDMGLM